MTIKDLITHLNTLDPNLEVGYRLYSVHRAMNLDDLEVREVVKEEYWHVLEDESTLNHYPNMRKHQEEWLRTVPNDKRAMVLLFPGN